MKVTKEETAKKIVDEKSVNTEEAIQKKPEQFEDNRNESKKVDKLKNASTNVSQLVIQRVISDGDYNAARKKLIDSGSASAGASHPKHTNGGSPDGHGVSLLQEARDEFRNTDAGQEGLKSGVTIAHYTAIHWAANKMSIDKW